MGVGHRAHAAVLQPGRHRQPARGVRVRGRTPERAYRGQELVGAVIDVDHRPRPVTGPAHGRHGRQRRGRARRLRAAHPVQVLGRGDLAPDLVGGVVLVLGGVAQGVARQGHVTVRHGRRGGARDRVGGGVAVGVLDGGRYGRSGVEVQVLRGGKDRGRALVRLRARGLGHQRPVGVLVFDRLARGRGPLGPGHRHRGGGRPSARGRLGLVAARCPAVGQGHRALRRHLLADPAVAVVGIGHRPAGREPLAHDVVVQGGGGVSRVVAVGGGGPPGEAGGVQVGGAAVTGPCGTALAEVAIRDGAAGIVAGRGHLPGGVEGQGDAAPRGRAGPDGTGRGPRRALAATRSPGAGRQLVAGLVGDARERARSREAEDRLVAPRIAGKGPAPVAGLVEGGPGARLVGTVVGRGQTPRGRRTSYVGRETDLTAVLLADRGHPRAVDRHAHAQVVGPAITERARSRRVGHLLLGQPGVVVAAQPERHARARDAQVSGGLDEAAVPGVDVVMAAQGFGGARARCRLVVAPEHLRIADGAPGQLDELGLGLEGCSGARRHRAAEHPPDVVITRVGDPEVGPVRGQAEHLRELGHRPQAVGQAAGRRPRHQRRRPGGLGDPDHARARAGAPAIGGVGIQVVPGRDQRVRAHFVPGAEGADEHGRRARLAQRHFVQVPAPLPAHLAPERAVPAAGCHPEVVVVGGDTVDALAAPAVGAPERRLGKVLLFHPRCRVVGEHPVVATAGGEVDGTVRAHGQELGTAHAGHRRRGPGGDVGALEVLAVP